MCSHTCHLLGAKFGYYRPMVDRSVDLIPCVARPSQSVFTNSFYQIYGKIATEPYSRPVSLAEGLKAVMVAVCIKSGVFWTIDSYIEGSSSYVTCRNS